MKIAPLIVIAAILGLGIAGWIYTSNQATTMKMIIQASGGAPDTDATGLRKTNVDLDGKVASASTERKDALKASEDALTMMRIAVDERNSTENELNNHIDERNDWKEKVADAKRRSAEIQEEADKLTAFLRTLPALGPDVDLATAVEKLRTVVEEEAEKNKTLKNDHEEKVVVRTAATEKVASETAELERLTEINNKFFRDYRKNGEEFVIQAVEPRWKFVVFTVGKESGLVVGDATPLLVKRGDQHLVTLRIVSITGGQVIAEYDSEELPQGVSLEVGDRVFRQKPLGS